MFHRACIFSSFDPDSVPDETERIATMRLVKPDEFTGSGDTSGPYWSLMLEISAGPLKTISEATIGKFKDYSISYCGEIICFSYGFLVDEAIRDACSVGLLRGSDEIVSLHMTEMTHGQPLPTLESETKVCTIVQFYMESMNLNDFNSKLEKAGISSRRSTSYRLVVSRKLIRLICCILRQSLFNQTCSRKNV